MALRKPETDAELELVTASLKKFVPDVATHSRSISGKKGAALVNQAGYERSATSASISLIFDSIGTRLMSRRTSNSRWSMFVRYGEYALRDISAGTPSIPTVTTPSKSPEY